jgi:3-keto-L-gulonate-6-phosphate decarboxylase
MACSPDEATCTKALALVSAHGADWRTAMATATDAAIDTIRTAVTQANSTDSDDFAEFMTGKAGASAMARLRDRVGPLRALQAELLQAIDAQCGPAAGRSAMIAAARASVPDYYELTDPSTGGIERISRALDAADPARTPVDAVRGAWIAADGDNARQLMELLRSLGPLDVPSSARDVPTRQVTDAALARLVAERERAAERAARDAWLALPETARAPKGALGGTLRFR